jgi:hypothetical protein
MTERMDALRGGVTSINAERLVFQTRRRGFIGLGEVYFMHPM